MRLLRGLRRFGVDVRDQSVCCMPAAANSFSPFKELDKDIFVVKASVEDDDIEELVEAYNVFISTVMKEVNEKMRLL